MAASDQKLQRRELYPQYEHEFAAALPGDADAFDFLREQMLVGYEYQTARAYWGDLEHWRDWCLQRQPEREPLAASDADIEGYLEELNQAGYSPNTRARRLTALRKFYGLACSHDAVAVDPTQTVRPVQRRKPVSK